MHKLPYHNSRSTIKSQFWMVVLAVVSIADAVVTLATLGYLTTDWRAWMLFCVIPE